MAALCRGASRVLLFDLPGHGESCGWCALGTRREIEVVRLVIESARPTSGDLAGVPIVLIGWSMGAGIAIACAECGMSVSAVVAEAPYRLAGTPARNVLRSARLPHRLNLPVALVLLNLRVGGDLREARFDRAMRAGAPGFPPMLVIHGEFDEISPIEDGRTIAHAARMGEFVMIEGGDHNGLWTDALLRAQCERAVLGFLARFRSSGESGGDAVRVGDAP